VHTTQANIPRIQDHAIIGDCRSAALVSNRGSIDWLCWPRFDSPAIFAAILDESIGGYWTISPVDQFRSQRSYVDSTNVLQTKFITSDGQAVLTDVMPVASEDEKRRTLLADHELIRRVECTEGQIQLEFDFAPRPDYGARGVRFRKLVGNCVRADVGRGSYWLTSSVPMIVKEDHAYASIQLKQGESAEFSLTYGEESPAVLPILGNAIRERIQRSVEWWQQWSAKCTYEGPYREAVIRSALVLKLMAYAPSGAIAAAPTTSLPERLGADLNWDYRFCWLRDASLTVRALVRLGYMDEVESFLDWLLHATRLTQPKLNVLYTIFGCKAPNERSLVHLQGHAGSEPVRIGNEAQSQLQMDVYGEVIEASAQFVRSGGHFDREARNALIAMGKHVSRNWDVADEGIWEPRTGRKHNTHSRLMCWVALDRLIEMQHRGELAGVPINNFSDQRRKISDQMHQRAWNSNLESYTSTLDGEAADATLLLLAWYGFEQPDSSRMKRTYRRVLEELGLPNSLLYRYKRNPPEGAFGVCCFWRSEYLAIGGGTLREARQSFEDLLQFRNDVGLYAEEIEPTTGDALGNFPQAFTHVGLINAAVSLQDRELGRSHEEGASVARGGPPLEEVGQ
jgi:GH15 family glucan-1,4-alpha-glucosidase